MQADVTEHMPQLKKQKIVRDEVMWEIAVENEEKIMNTPIRRNSKGVPIIELFNNQGEKVAEALVDEDKYYNLMHYSWCLGVDGYIIG